MSKLNFYETGKLAPSNITREYGAIYIHQTAKGPITYIQSNFPSGRTWKISTEIAPGPTPDPDGNGIYGGTGIVPTATVATVTDTFTLDGGLVEVTGDLETRDLTITDNNTLNLQTTDSVAYLGINNTFVPAGVPPNTPPDAGPAIKVGNKIFYSDYWYNVIVYDADTNTQLGVSATITDGAYNLAYNPTLDRIYVGNWENGWDVAYMDATTFATTNIPITGPSAFIGKLLFDDTNQVLYSITSFGIHQYDADFVYTGVNITPAMGINDLDIVDIGLDTTGNLIITSYDSIWFYDNTGTLLNTLSGYRNNNDYARATDNLGIAISSAGQFFVFVANKIVVFFDGNTTPIVAVVNTIGGETYTALVITEYSLFGGIKTAAFVSATYPLGYGYSQLGGNFAPLFGGLIYPALTFTKTNGNLFVYFLGTNIFYEIEQLFITNLTVSIDTETLTGNRTQLLQDADGTIALLSDIPDNTLLGNSVFVSAEGKTVANGAVRGSLTDHFSNINEAVIAAQSGDTIYVYGGTHTVTANLYKAGVIWHFLGEPTISANFGVTLFTNVGVTANLIIKGDAKFVNAFYTGGPNARIFGLTGTANTIDITCKSITMSGSEGFIFTNTTGKLTVTQEIRKTSNDYMLRLFGATSITVTTPLMISTNGNTTNFDSIISTETDYTGESIFNVDLITKTINQFSCIRIQGGGKITINGNITYTTASTGFNIAVVFINTASASTLEVNGNITTNGHAYNVYSGANQTFIHKNGILTSIATNAAYFLVNSAAAGTTFELSGKYVDDGSATTVIAMTGSTGTLKMNGAEVTKSTSAVGGTRGLDVSGTSLVLLNNTKIVLDTTLGAAESIYASAAKDVKILQGNVGSNVAANVNITNIITGTSLIVDTDFQ